MKRFGQLNLTVEVVSRTAITFQLCWVNVVEDLPEDHGAEDHDVKSEGDDATADRDD